MSVTAASSDYSKAAIQGTFWRYLTFFSGKVMLLISTAILARILSKDDFGVVGYAITAINLLDIFSDMGIGPALIYHSEDKETSSTAFWINLSVSILLFIFAWFSAPLLALYFRDERATEVIRILSLTFPIIALGNTHQKLIEKKLAFKRTFLPEFIRSMTKGGSAIVFAFWGLGAWSLILGQLCAEVIASIAYWLSIPWKPAFRVSREKARLLMDYGARYVGADAVAVVLLNLDYLLVGRYLGVEALGVYTLAFRLPDLVVLQFARTLSGVIFPIYSKMRETSDNLARGFLLTTRYISLITVPLGAGLALVAKPFTEVLFSEKWVEAVPAIQGIAVYSLLLSLAYNAGGAYKASGRPQTIAWLGLLRLMILFPALWWAVHTVGTIAAVSWTHAGVALVSTVISLYVAARMLGLKMSEIFSALFPAVLAGSVMILSVLGVLFLVGGLGAAVQLTFCVLTGGTVYLFTLWLFQRDVIVDAGEKFRSALGASKNARRSNA